MEDTEQYNARTGAEAALHKIALHSADHIVDVVGNAVNTDAVNTDPMVNPKGEALSKHEMGIFALGLVMAQVIYRLYQLTGYDEGDMEDADELIKTSWEVAQEGYMHNPNIPMGEYLLVEDDAA